MTGPRYVYAVCRPLDAPLQVQLAGIGGAPPTLLHHHGLVVVVSDVPEADYSPGVLADWLADTVRAHRGVVDALSTVTTPVPLPPAALFRDDSAVRAMIEAREDDFRRLLHRLHGRVEWGVRLYAADGRGRGHEHGRGQGQGAEGGDADDAAEAFARTLHQALAWLAEDSRLFAPESSVPAEAAERNVLDAAYLVPRARSEEFVEMIERARAEELGVRIELDGPRAAYSFTGEEPWR
ncbi:GvpL/GvpF family gas vesicle protein [Streptomyces sp. NBC_00820]|uniref:GvpL/GvpF family gas vesicle protein n=1 Tax=Streptomyces sp. NBC_00820 TaxID=2975842 RepID=UPI002ED33A83|nr:GvpL/GvpF family gas vesicle protein [Streptomyces sp. NBC_00820]